MTEILVTKSEYFDKIDKIISQDCDVKIATYNIYTGVTTDGRYVNNWGGGQFENRVGHLLDNLTNISSSTTIKIGKPFFGECALMHDSQCSMMDKENNWESRLRHTKRRWHKIDFKLIENSHIKLVLVSPDHCLYGGRNFADSDNLDLSWYEQDLAQYKKLVKIFNVL